MYGLASNRVTVLRGTAVNAYGDVVDDPANNLVVARDLPAQIYVSSSRAYDPTSQQIRVIHTVEGRMPSDTDVVEGDQIQDDATGVIYMIESVTQRGGPGFVSDLEMVLKRLP